MNSQIEIKDNFGNYKMFIVFLLIIHFLNSLLMLLSRY